MVTRQNDTESGINRRSYMKLTAAAVGSSALVGSATQTASAASLEVVDLADKGLSNGDKIDPYLDEYFEKGVEVRVPQGEYEWDGKGFAYDSSGDAAVIGQGEVILNLDNRYREIIEVSSGVVEIKNFTIRGKADDSRFRLEAASDGRILIDNVNFPDGTEAGGNSRAFYLPREHAGVVEIRNCYYADFDDNGIYASSPGYPGEGGGQIIVENCTSRRVNIGGIRVGPDNSIVRNCLILNDGRAPRSPGGSVNMRGIRIRAPGKDQVIEDCEMIYSEESSGSPISFSSKSDGSTGTVRNVRISNDSSSDAIGASSGTTDGWSGENISITGSGDLDYPSDLGGVTTGSSAEEPTGEDPSGEDSTDRSDDSDTSEPPESTDGTDRLLITTSPSDGATYEFTATEKITPLYELDEFNANDDDVGEEASQNNSGTWTATGALSGAGSSGDSFDFDGEITAFSIDGDSNAVRLYLNGDEISVDNLVVDQTNEDEPADPPADEDEPADPPVDDDELSNVLLIDGTASPDLAQYKAVVSGEIERSDSLSSVVDDESPWDNINDRVAESTATGVVAKGLDGYRFSGKLVSFQVNGHVDLTIEQVDQ